MQSFKEKTLYAFAALHEKVIPASAWINNNAGAAKNCFIKLMYRNAFFL